MLQLVIYAATALAVLAYCIEYLFVLRDHGDEPQRLKSKVPLIGHILGLIRSGPSYHNELRNATDSEIYTLGIFHFKLYTSVSTRLLPAIQRQSKTLSFRPMLQHVARRWGDASQETDGIFAGPHFVSDYSRAMRLSLAPGLHLDEQNERMATRALIDIEALVQEASVRETSKEGGGAQILLLQWARHAVTQASSCGIYGVRHPFLDPEVEKAFWLWHAHLSAHISGLNFDFLGKGYSARQKVFDAHATYCREMPEDASMLLRERWRVLREAGVSETDCIKQQATLPIGMLSNTVPTCYWAIWELFSRQHLLAEVRDEVEKHAVLRLGETSFALDLAALKTQCPLLLSVFQETQRTRHIHAAIRKVMEDMVLDGRYLLKAGNYLQMPGRAIHSHTGIWGPTALQFDGYRFVDAEKKRGGSDFLAWGAPPHLCPARQFAATEILIMVALLAVRVDLRPLSGGWEESPALDFNDPITVLNPKKDVAMHVIPRPQWEGRWSIRASRSTVRVPLASG